MGGTDVRVLLDTGSSDLWVNFQGATPVTAPLNKKVDLAYAIGRVSGDVQTTDVLIGNRTVPQQAFIHVKDTSTFAGDIHSQGYDGLLGLGPNEASNILDEVDDPKGDTLLHRIFQAQGAGSHNYITMLLDRKNDTSDPFPGQFTISEPVEQFKQILNEPKLNVAEVFKFMEADQHWQALTDKDIGIIGPDGEVIASDSIVPKAPDGQMVAVFDSGFTFSQVPRDVADAIYGRVKGAQYSTKDEMWLVPCGQMLNLTFNFGGKKFPIHPLDVVNDDFRRKDANGNHVCIGAFQPITTAFSIFGNFDMILGMSFMRSVYTLMEYGDWLNDKTSEQQDPYIQLLSVTDAAAARQEFIQVRHNGQDETGLAQWQLLPKDQMQHSPVSDEEKKKKYQEMVLSRWPYILAGCLVGVLLIVGLIVWKCCCRRKKAPSSKANNWVNNKGGAEANTSYVPLQVPAGGHSTASLSERGYGSYKGNGHY